MEPDAINSLLQAEACLQELQKKNADRNRAVALTHIQTAILWLNKHHVDEALTQEKNSYILRNPSDAEILAKGGQG